MKELVKIGLLILMAFSMISNSTYAESPTNGIEQRISSLDVIDEASFEIKIPDVATEPVEVSVVITSNLPSTSGLRFLPSEPMLEIYALVIEEVAGLVNRPTLLKKERPNVRSHTMTLRTAINDDRIYKINIYVSQSASKVP